ncbi:MAG: hypothetical protein JWR86_900, partial [Enterovirga sp.]|nr:hypothetical protein [Enterovirga sp.]
MLGFGVAANAFILHVAELLRNEAIPGLVATTLVISLVVAGVAYGRGVLARVSAARMLRAIVQKAADEASFGRSIVDLDAEILKSGGKGARKQVATAWDKYRETLVEHDEDGVTILRNSVRPAVFFNADDLGFTPGLWRIVPGLFVTVGLFLTF